MKQAQSPRNEPRVVTVKDEFRGPAGSTGTPSWQNLLFGAFAGQPLRRSGTSASSPPPWRIAVRLASALGFVSGTLLLLNLVFGSR